MNNLGKIYYELTYPQKSIWLTEQFHSGTSISNVSGTLIFDNEVDFNILEKSIRIFVSKNESMKIKLCLINGNPKQYIDHNFELDIDYIDLSDSNDFESDLKNIESLIVNKPFELLDSNLFKFTIIKAPYGKARI